MVTGSDEVYFQVPDLDELLRFQGAEDRDVGNSR